MKGIEAMMNFLNTLRINDYVNGNTIAAVLVLIILFYTILLLRSIRKYFNNKVSESEAQIKLKALEEQRLSEERLDPYYYRLDGAKKLMGMIETMISDEIGQLLFSYETIGQKYQLTKLNTDAEAITKSVFEGISPALLDSKNSCYTKEYLMKVISRLAVSSLIENVRIYNDELRNKKLEG